MKNSIPSLGRYEGYYGYSMLIITSGLCTFNKGYFLPTQSYLSIIHITVNYRNSIFTLQVQKKGAIISFLPSIINMCYWTQLEILSHGVQRSLNLTQAIFPFSSLLFIKVKLYLHQNNQYFLDLAHNFKLF